jgi:hypothetical protein
MKARSLKAERWLACLFAVAIFSSHAVMAQVIPAPPQPTGSVTGVVRTAAGTPAPGIRVTAMRADAMDDALRAMVSLAQTDATGRYRLEGIPPGQYYIAAGRVDLPTYFPGTLEVTRGTALSISSATPLSDIDFVIQDTSASVPPGRGTPFGVRGRGVQPVRPPNIPIPNVQIPDPQWVQPFVQNFQNRNRGAVPTAPAPPAPPRVAQVPAPPTPSVNQRYTVGTNLLRSIANQPNAAWWTNAALVARLGLTAEQMKKVEATFDQYRQAIVQNTTDLAREEAALERLLETDPLEPAKIISPQIDRVIQARGELERTNSKMTLEMRQSLTRAQWVQLQMETQLPAQNYSFQMPVQTRGASPARPGRGNRATP